MWGNRKTGKLQQTGRWGRTNRHDKSVFLLIISYHPQGVKSLKVQT